MNVVKFLYSQIKALPPKDRQEFARLWEESKKYSKPIKKEKKLPITTAQEHIKMLKNRGIWK